MKVPATILGATAVGFVGIISMHGPLARSSPVAKVTSPPVTGTTQPGSATTPTTVGSSAIVNGSAIGQLENYGYGEMSVKVTIVNNRIVDLKIASLKTLESYSQQLEQQVVPILKTEVLQAQGTKISALSGATYTSEAYAYSIQSALDKLHFK